MARQERIILKVPNGAGAETAQVVDRHNGITILFTTAAIGGGTLQIEGSIDGSAFAQVGSDVSAAGFVSVSETLQWIRLRRTAGSSTDETVELLAFDQRAQ